MQNGLMGEAGPEAIMPLKRGADGKLGVAAKLDGAMGRYRRSPGAAGGTAGGGATTEAAAGGTATMEPIDVRYSVERINNVEYVTADQFRAGMAQAAQQGAIQGERRAMRTLTNSAAARGRLGI
jgi:phage-related minor tail protein